MYIYLSKHGPPASNISTNHCRLHLKSFMFHLRSADFYESVTYLVVISPTQYHFVHSGSYNLLLAKTLLMNFGVVSQKQLAMNSEKVIFIKMITALEELRTF